MANFARNFDKSLLQYKAKNLDFIAVRRHNGSFSVIFFTHSSKFVQKIPKFALFVHFTQDFVQAMKNFVWPATFRNSELQETTFFGYKLNQMGFGLVLLCNYQILFVLVQFGCQKTKCIFFWFGLMVKKTKGFFWFSFECKKQTDFFVQFSCKKK